MEMTTDRRLVEGKGERRRESEHWEGLVPNGLERLLDRVRLVNLRTEIRLDFAERIALAYIYQKSRRRKTAGHNCAWRKNSQRNMTTIDRFDRITLRTQRAPHAMKLA